MQEMDYLVNALSKARRVVAVFSFDISSSERKFKYISPNAYTFGINTELVSRGLKLFEDYIFPDDRNKVVDTIYNAISANIESYAHSFKIVNDNGNVLNVSADIAINQISKDIFEVEFYLKEVAAETESKVKISSKTIVKPGEIIKKVNRNGKIFDAGYITNYDKVNSVLSVFSAVSNLYSVVVDEDGNIVIPPIGPELNLGDYYDLFETPAYKMYFQQIKSTVLENDEPVVMDREEGGDGKVSAAPLRYKDKLIGFWILGSYTKEESEELKRLAEYQWITADIVSDYLYKSVVLKEEVAKSKKTGKKLKEQLERQNIINLALTKINSKIIDSVEQVLYETFKDVGKNLSIDRIFLCTVNKNNNRAYSLRSLWDANSDEVGEEFFNDLSERLFVFEENMKNNQGEYFVDSANGNEQEKFDLMNLGFNAMVAQSIYMNEGYYGILFFAESTSERVWSEEEIHFTKSIAIVVQNMLENAEGDDNIRKVNKHLIETYNNFNVGIFVKDICTGKVLFSNTYMNEMIGHDLTGEDSRRILTDLHDRFDNIDSMRKPFVDREKVATWRSYVKVLDSIMDITSINIEWLHGEAAAVIILRNAKDF